MATSVMQPSSSPNLSSTMDPEDNFSNLRVASFSTYLNPVEDNSVLKLTESYQDPSLAIDLKDEPVTPRRCARSKAEEGEISVFAAKKYFTMNIDGESSPTRLSENDSTTSWHRNEEQVDLQHRRPRVRSATPSASSEASSWNSQTALFRSFMRNSTHNKQKNAIGNRFFTAFACRGSCNDGKSVYTNRNVSVRGDQGRKVTEKAILGGINSIMSDKTKLFEGKGVAKKFKGENTEEGRNSLEVFGLQSMKRGDIAANLERKLSVLTWDAIPKSQHLPTVASSVISDKCEDMESDTSSDLFEIENISCGMSTCMTPTTIYAPSEASIEWSVVTASAADITNIADIEEKKPTEEWSFSNKNKAIKGKEWGKSRSSGLLGCRSQKAVGVWENACKTKSDQGWQQMSVSSMQMRKVQSETKVKGFEFPQVQHSIASRVLPSSHPALSSLSRYM